MFVTEHGVGEWVTHCQPRIEGVSTQTADSFCLVGFSLRHIKRRSLHTLNCLIQSCPWMCKTHYCPRKARLTECFPFFWPTKYVINHVREKKDAQDTVWGFSPLRRYFHSKLSFSSEDFDVSVWNIPELQIKTKHCKNILWGSQLENLGVIVLSCKKTLWSLWKSFCGFIKKRLQVLGEDYWIVNNLPRCGPAKGTREQC